MLLNSCSKEKEVQGVDTSVGDVQVLVNLLGIELEDENIEKLGSTQINRASPKVISTSTVKLEDGMKALVSLTEEPVDKSNKLTLSHQRDKVAAASPMQNGVAYVVVFYDVKDNHIATINTTDKAAPTALKQFRWNTTYKWFAYSFNNSNPITLNSTSNPTVVSKEIVDCCMLQGFLKLQALKLKII